MGYFRSIRWDQPPAGFGIAAPPAGPFELYGVPRLAENLPPVEEARQLLMAAAEVEHSLLVEYLYGAYSAGKGLPDASGKIINVAIQEMGHLITVQNLLLLIGGTVHLDRGNAPGGDPAAEPFPFILEPLSLGSLAKYLLAEKPADRFLVPGSEDDAAVQDALKQSPDAGIVMRVGLIYSTLSWLFQATDNGADPDLIPDASALPAGRHLADSDFVSGPELAARQITADDWFAGSDLVPPAGNRQEALAVIRQIASQGEGIGQVPDSHFHIFAGLYRKAEKAGLPIGADVPSAPYLATTPDDPSPAAISHPVSALWVRYLDIRYAMLLLDIHHGLLLPASDPLRQTLFQDWAIANEMRSALAQLAPKIMTLKRTKGDPQPGAPRYAGPVFTLPATFPLELAGVWQRHRQLILGAESVFRAIDPALSDPMLAPIYQFDQYRLRDVIDPAIQGGA